MKTAAFSILVAFSVGLATPIVGQDVGPTREQVSVNGVSLAYRDLGEGDPLVLLHGFFGTGADWSEVTDEFGASYRLIIPDLRGHGRSTNPTGQFTHREAARDIYALLDHLGIERFSAVGFSSGGMTLLHMATTQGHRLEAAVLIGATSYFPGQARELMLGSAPDRVSPGRLEAMAGRHGGVERAQALLDQFYGFRGSYRDMNFTPPLLATISTRTLIVHGDRDPFFPVQIPVEAFRAIPDSYLWVVPNGGHVLLPSAESDRQYFVETLLEFLSGSWN